MSAAKSAALPMRGPYLRGRPVLPGADVGRAYSTAFERRRESSCTDSPKDLRSGLNRPLLPNQLSQTTNTGVCGKQRATRWKQRATRSINPCD